jgi:hypothetical protein
LLDGHNLPDCTGDVLDPAVEFKGTGLGEAEFLKAAGKK